MVGNNDMIRKYFGNRFSDFQMDGFGRLAEEITQWNSKINVISRKDIENIWVNHILHSLSVLHYFDFKGVKTVLDIGTGGGFPGLPLAIALPHLEFTLIDGRSKKIFVVQQIAESLSLKNVKALKARSEELKERFDIITGRAVTDVVRFRADASKNLKKGGSILYWTGAEAADRLNDSFAYQLDRDFYEDWFLNKCIVKIN